MDAHQNMRNWSLKTIAGFRACLAKIAVNCPEAEADIFRVKFNLAEMERHIRENQPPGDEKRAADKAEKRKVKRIFVR